jgi:3-hydroxybutyryl-CoA dehydrogenase
MEIHRVRMADVSATALARALDAISGNPDRVVRNGVLDGADPASFVERIETGTDAAQGVRDTDLVVYVVPERAELKYELFRVLDAEAPPNAVLASNTSSISITEIAARTSRPDSVIGMHFIRCRSCRSWR